MGVTILNTSPDEVGQELLLLSEHEKHTLDREFFWFTLSGHLVEQRTPEALLNEAGDVLAKIHPGAQALGYRFAEVTLDKGYRGSYQRLVISRLPS